MFVSLEAAGKGDSVLVLVSHQLSDPRPQNVSMTLITTHYYSVVRDADGVFVCVRVIDSQHK